MHLQKQRGCDLETDAGPGSNTIRFPTQRTSTVGGGEESSNFLLGGGEEVAGGKGTKNGQEEECVRGGLARWMEQFFSTAIEKRGYPED